jgi:hypothetical protein
VVSQGVLEETLTAFVPVLKRLIFLILSRLLSPSARWTRTCGGTTWEVLPQGGEGVNATGMDEAKRVALETVELPLRYRRGGGGGRFKWLT